MKKINIGVLVSGGGSNLQAIIDATKNGILPLAEVAVVISNKPGVFALERASRENIPSLILDPKTFESRALYFERVIGELKKRECYMVCLAGFLLKLEANMINAFRNRILNIHPALLPQFGGKGLYGHFVHEAVLAAGERMSGCTVHVVDEQYDHGQIILQRKAPVEKGDTPETLAARVLKEEHMLYPEAIRAFLAERSLI